MGNGLIGGIEAGGTKFVCGVADASLRTIETRTIPTRDPETTFAEVMAFFAEARRHGPLAGLGIAAFGPVRVDPLDQDYGRIERTPKPGWQAINPLRHFREALGVPALLDTDVNAAALAEWHARARPEETLAYVTVGTGIGVGIVVAGAAIHGLGHPEAGHLPVRRNPNQADFPGICPYHGDCLEGLASGPAIAAAWGAPAESLPPDHPAWDDEADYLGQLAASLFLTIAPHRIVFGGGVMHCPDLLERIRVRCAELLGGYVAALDVPEALSERIVSPTGRGPGLIGAYHLGLRAALAER